MPTSTIVTTSGTVSGGSWSATCGTAVSGSTWYSITAVNGTSVSTLYGVSVAYAATGLFAPPTSPPPTPAVYLEGIDVSHYQGTIDWPSVVAAGKRFAIVQATDGETCLDPMYATNHTGARAVGAHVTAYHFAEPSSSPDEAVLQADWFVNNAALLPGDLVPALDLERSGGLSASSLQAWVLAWLGEVYAKLGVRPMIYSSPSFWANSMGDTTTFADQGYSVMWIAHWGTSSPTVPASNWGGHGWTFWQYSSKGSTAGIAGLVDLDRYNGSDLSSVSPNYTYVPPPPVVPPNAPPMLAALTPTTAAAGGGDVTITIQGANFACAASTAYWNGTPLATTYVSPTQLAAVVPAALTAMPGTSSVTVVNQTPGGGTSAPAAFSVTGSTVGTPPPVLAALTPTTAPAGGGDVTITIQGANFAAGASTAYWNGTPLATTYVSPTQLAAVVPAALTAMPGTSSVTVVNQTPGGGTSAPAAFSVTAPLPPVLAALTPTTAPAGGGDVTITIQGANFAAGASTAYWNGTPLATMYVSPMQLAAVLPAALTAMPGTSSVTVVNQTPVGGTSAPAAFSVTAPLPLLSIGTSSAIGLKPARGYTAATPKVTRVDRYVTWKFNLGAALAGQRVNVLVANRVGTAWGGPKYSRSAWADANGVVTLAWTRTTAGAINIRVQLYGSASYAVSTSPALGAYWR